MKSIYRGCARDILGLRRNASGEATLVRLGWLPLDYRLALLGMKCYIRWRVDKDKRKSKRELKHIMSSESASYVFFDRALEFLIYL